VLTADLDAWARANGVTLTLAHEFERFCAYGLAHDKQYCDFGAAFKAWLLHPLTSQGLETARHQDAQRAAQLHQRHVETEALRRQEYADQAKALNDPALAAERDAAAKAGLAALGAVLGPNWRVQAKADDARHGHGAPARRRSSVIRPDDEQGGDAA
jgi:hypothetical protein